jgi:hypothetical protein
LELIMDWNCPAYLANITDRQCLINREVRRHRDPQYACRDCRRGQGLAQSQPQVQAEIAAKYRTEWMRRKLRGQDITGSRF